MSSEKKWRGSRRWKKEIPTGPLSHAEFELFKQRQTRVWKALGILVAYLLCLGLLVEAKTIYGLVPSVLILSLAAFPVGICLLIALLLYRCPRCGATPMAKTFSFTTASFEYGSFVSLLPKACGKCGVQFEKPAEDGTGGPMNQPAASE